MKLESKNRFEKVKITDIAIEKVKKIDYPAFTESQNDALHELTKKVLILSMSENDSNEVAITCNIDDDPLKNYGIALGDEHNVDIGYDSNSYHIIANSKTCAVVIMHNHPQLQTFSFKDIRFFLANRSIKLMIVVDNLGNTHYMQKETEYNEKLAYDIYNDCISLIDDNTDVEEVYKSCLLYLAKCSEANILYR